MLSLKAQTLLGTVRDAVQSAIQAIHGGCSADEIRYRALCRREAEVALEVYIASLELLAK